MKLGIYCLLILMLLFYSSAYTVQTKAEKRHVESMRARRYGYYYNWWRCWGCGCGRRRRDTPEGKEPDDRPKRYGYSYSYSYGCG